MTSDFKSKPYGKLEMDNKTVGSVLMENIKSQLKIKMRLRYF